MFIKIVTPPKIKDKLFLQKDTRNDELLKQLNTFNSEQIDSYIENNIVDLQSTKKLLKILVKSVILLQQK